VCVYIQGTSDRPLIALPHSGAEYSGTIGLFSHFGRLESTGFSKPFGLLCNFASVEPTCTYTFRVYNGLCRYFRK
jgi:hypothetical protein